MIRKNKAEKWHMLSLQHLKKYYQTGDTVTKALDDVSVNFRDSGDIRFRQNDVTEYYRWLGPL